MRQTDKDRQTDNVYSIDWEDKEVIQKTDFLDEGCTCKTGCKTEQCGCQKAGRHCGSGCECRGCTNTQELEMDEEQEIDEESELSEEEYDTEDSEEGLQTEIITDMNFDDVTDWF